MSFNRPLYDTCQQKKHEDNSASIGLYALNTPVICDNCFQPNPSIRMQKSGVSMNKNTPWRFYHGPVDVETDLKNINRTLSNCPEEQYQKKEHFTESLNDCWFASNSNTRLSDPANNLKGKAWNRFGYPLCDPQKDIILPQSFMLPSRMIAKDSHRPKVPRPAINNMHPNEKKQKCGNTSNVCGNPVNNLHH
jgi:hypothetical protein